MLANLRIAWEEFLKDILLKRTGAPGALDFLWLALFSALTMLLACLAWSAAQSVNDRFEQVLLGADEVAGIPIHLGKHFDQRRGFGPEILKAFEKDFPHLRLVPMRDFDPEQGLFTVSGLNAVPPDEPQETSQKAPSPGKDKTPPTIATNTAPVVQDQDIDPLLALALPIDSPLWQHVLTRAGKADIARSDFPRILLASKSAFRKHFRHAAYLKAFARQPPFSCYLRATTVSKEGAVPEAPPSLPRSLIVNVDEGADRENVSQDFEVVWVDSFPLPEPVVFIVPLTTYDLVEAMKFRPLATLHLEAEGAPISRVSDVWLSDVDRDTTGRAEFETFAGCLGAAKQEASPSDGSSETWSIGWPCGSAANAKPESGAIELVPGALVKPKKEAVRPRPERDRPENDWFGESPSTTAGPASALHLRLPLPLPKVAIDACLAKSGLEKVLESAGKKAKDRLRLETAATSQGFAWLGEGRITAPCSALRADFDLGARQTAEASRNCAKTADGTSVEAATPDASGVIYSQGYARAIVYVPRNRSFSGVPAFGGASGRLNDVVKALLAWKHGDASVFRLSPTYEMALVRFGVLSTIISAITLPIAVGAVGFYIFLSWVILATAFSHRRGQYGLLMLCGTSTTGLLQIVLTQILLCSLMGAVLGYTASLGVILLGNMALLGSEIIGNARDVIGFDATSFLAVVGPLEAMGIWLTVAVMTCAVGAFVLWARGITTARAPIDLLKT